MDQATDRVVISASRRTDIPAFYLDWFLGRLRQGSFVSENPCNGLRRQVAAHPRQVQAIVLWSKDYSRLLARAEELAAYRLYLNFTVNSESPVLEPRVPPLGQRLAQMRELARRFGGGAINWRFDPIVFWEEDARRRNNLGQFERILSAAAGAGVRRLTVSFLDRYPKIERRVRPMPGFRFHYPDLDEMVDTLIPLATKAREAGLEVRACCERPLLDCLPTGLVEGGSCVDGLLLSRLFGPGASLAPDRGQRRQSGCGCTQSIDVGSYSAHPCPHACLYCYANPAPAPLPLAAHA